MDASRKIYSAIVTGNSLAVSKDKQTPSVKIAVQTEYLVESPGVRVSKKLYGDLWLSYAAIERSVKTLKEAFSYTGPIEALNEPILVGKRCNIVCEDDEYNGQVREKILFFNRHSTLSRLDGDALSSVLDHLSQLRASKPGVLAEPEFTAPDFGRAVPAAPSVINEDLPF